MIIQFTNAKIEPKQTGEGALEYNAQNECTASQTPTTFFNNNNHDNNNADKIYISMFVTNVVYNRAVFL